MKQLVSFAAAGLLAVAAWAQPAMTNGEVTKLDKPGGRVTLKHGEIKNLDMPPMTMNFRVADPKLLDDVVVGDRVRFVAERVNGQFTITTLSKTR